MADPNETPKAVPTFRVFSPVWLAAALLILFADLPALCQGRNPGKTTAADSTAPTRTDWTPAGYVNDAFPRWMRFSGEFRARWENDAGYGLAGSSGHGYLLTRLRINIDVHPARWFRVFVQGQDSRLAGVRPEFVTASQKDVFDLRQAYVELNAGEKGWISLRAGRQELSFGRERLVGSGGWSNGGRAFDAIRFALVGEGKRLDVFASSVVVNSVTHFDHHRPGENLHGIYGALAKLVPKASVEGYSLWKTMPLVRDERGRQGDSDVYTLGARIAGKLPCSFDYAAEIAHQHGHYAADEVAAWAHYSILGYSLPQGVAWKPRFSVEYDYASGDNAQGDGRRRTFDQLYPTNHSYYGTADRLGWRNSRTLRGGMQITPRPKLRLNADYLSFWLATPHDGLYGDNGSVSVRVPMSGALHKDIGTEIDIFVTFTPRRDISIGAGAGHLFPGRFLTDSMVGASTYPYVFVTYRL